MCFQGRFFKDIHSKSETSLFTTLGDLKPILYWWKLGQLFHSEVISDEFMLVIDASSDEPTTTDILPFSPLPR